MSVYAAGQPDLETFSLDAPGAFRDLVESLPVAVFVAAPSGRLTYVNPAFTEIFGDQSLPESAGNSWDYVLFPDINPRADFLSRFRSAGAVVNWSAVLVGPDGRKQYLSVSAAEMRGDGGEVIGVRGTVVDVSERGRQEERLRSEDKDLGEILGFYNSLSDIRDLPGLHSQIVSQTAGVFNARRCSLMMVHGDGSELLLQASCGIPEEAARDVRVKLGESVSGMVAARGQAVLVNDIESHEVFKRQKRKGYRSGAFMCAPLFYEHKLLGIISVADKDGGFTPTDLGVFEIIARQSAISISRIKLLHSFEVLAQTDPMTGLLNYRSFAQRMEEETARAARYGQVFSVMMADIDHFKRYNDTNGHPGGDTLLRSLAATFRSCLRSTEFVYRYAGDEFAVILPGTEAAQAAVAGEKVRQAVEAAFGPEGISLSIGVAQYQTGIVKEALVGRADQALYQAKARGRNAVVMFSPVL
ncbi:MAG: diguanylate cyclase [Candidatus Omnitrophota bacterium]